MESIMPNGLVNLGLTVVLAIAGLQAGGQHSGRVEAAQAVGSGLQDRLGRSVEPMHSVTPLTASVTTPLTTSTWTQQAELTATNGLLGDELGSALTMTGTTALVGAPGKG